MPEGWEDRLGLEQDAALLGEEIPIPHEDVAADALSGLATSVAALVSLAPSSLHVV
jgi:hypothetical protein